MWCTCACPGGASESRWSGRLGGGGGDSTYEVIQPELTWGQVTRPDQPLKLHFQLWVAGESRVDSILINADDDAHRQVRVEGGVGRRRDELVRVLAAGEGENQGERLGVGPEDVAGWDLGGERGGGRGGGAAGGAVALLLASTSSSCALREA